MTPGIANTLVNRIGFKQLSRQWAAMNIIDSVVTMRSEYKTLRKKKRKIDSCIDVIASHLIN